MVSSFVHSDARHTCWCEYIEQVFSTADLQLAPSQIHSLACTSKNKQFHKTQTEKLCPYGITLKEMCHLWSFLA